MPTSPRRPRATRARRSRFSETKRRFRDVLFGGLGGLYGLEDASEYGPFTSRQLLDLLNLTKVDQYFLGVAGVTGVIVATGPETDSGRFASSHPDRARPQDLPLVAVPGSDLAVALAPGCPRAVFVPYALAERPLVPGRLTCAPVPLLERDAWHARVECDAPDRGLVVLSDLYLDGVTAEVDGAPVETRFTDCALVAVPVTKGPHRVLVEWHVPGLPAGVVATLAGLLLMWWFGFRRAS